MSASPQPKPVEPPAAVVEAIRNAWPDQADAILASLRYHPGDDFWSFTRWGHFVGVERDGYIHT